MIDDHKTELKAMELFKCGKMREASAMQDKFLAEVKASGEDHCSCPSACKFHGKCVECVTLHRGHGDHLPYCFRAMLNRKINNLSELSEHSFKSEE
jgi:hypothetical protein